MSIPLRSLVARALALCVAAPLAAAPQGEGGSFALPETRTARALAESVREHIQSSRWPEAMSGLQKLIEENAGDLLAGEFPVTADGLRSERYVYQGAARWAHDQLLRLPRDVREQYRRFHEQDASVRLERAQRDKDRRGLVELARRWPVTRAAERAMWSLGDLELELGNVTEAFHAWERAAGLHLGDPEFAAGDAVGWRAAVVRLERSSAPGAEGALRRATYALERLASSTGDVLDGSPPHRASERAGREVRGIGTADVPVTVPTGQQGSWAVPFELPDHPFRGEPGFNLFPIRSGDTVFVSTSLELFALNAFTGELRWRSGEPDGWTSYRRRRHFATSHENDVNDLFRGIDERYAIIAPAATDSIVVAALQVPVATGKNEKYQNIGITRIMPERRLFAFDAATGRELWNHAPPLDWDGEQGTFAQRMLVAGPPAIAGTRLLVPCYRMQGRIYYHVACYDLSDGSLLWSTALISGQRELNMFSRPEFEFSAAPLRIEGEKVIALTQLGSVAALDLTTGTPLWQTVYDQMDLPEARWAAMRRDLTWQNSGPVVSGDVVIAAPVDSQTLCALDLETGAMLWSQRMHSGGRSESPDALLGVDDETIWLGGARVVALRGPASLRRLPVVLWNTDKDAFHRGPRPWGALGAKSVLAPTAQILFEFDREEGALVGQPRKLEHIGNLLLTPGATFTLSNGWLNGYFEWSSLLDEARSEYARKPDRPGPAVRLARLLVDRADSHWRDGEFEPAARNLDEAWEVLQPWTEERGGDSAATMHEVLRSRARVALYRGDDPSVARETLRRARDLAPNVGALRDTLLQEEELWRGGPIESWLEVMSALETSCGDQLIELQVVGVEGEPEARLVPRLSPPEDTAPDLVLTCDLWVRIERARRAAEAGRYFLALDDLHALIATYGDVQLTHGDVRARASRELGRLLEIPAARDAYEPFEASADDLLARAKTEDKDDLVALVPRFYPHSRASEQANDLLLDGALRRRDAEEIARIVMSDLPRTWRAEDASDRDVELLIGLATTLGSRGNRDLERSWLMRLAEALPHDERIAAALARTFAPVARLLPSERSTFDADVRPTSIFNGRWSYVGRVPGATAGDEERHEVALFVSDEGLLALSSTAPSDELWSAARYDDFAVASAREVVALAPGRVIYPEQDFIVARDRENGDTAWSYEVEEGEVRGIRAADGVAVCMLAMNGGTIVYVALDTTSGVELWREPIPSSRLRPNLPVLGSGRAVLLPQIQFRTVVVLDLFTGRERTRFELTHPPEPLAHVQVWIHENLLVEPRFYMHQQAELNRVTGYDLDSGAVRWSENFDESGERALHSIADVQGERFLVLRGAHGAQRTGAPGRVVRLLPDFGALQPVGELRLDNHDTELLPRQRACVVESPLLFVRSPSPDGQRTLLRAVHLPQGELWAHTLPIAENDLYLVPLDPPPFAVSRTTVAMVFNEWPSSHSKAGPTRLLFVDRATGMRRDQRDLDPDRQPRSDDVEPIALGGALLLRGPKTLEVLE